MTATTLTPLHLQLIRALAEDAVKRGLLADTDAARACAAEHANATAPVANGDRSRRDSGHDLPRASRTKRMAQRVAAGIDKAAAFSESWAGLACAFVCVTALAWHRWPVLEAMA